MAASPLPSWGSSRGWKCYVTPAFSGLPKHGDKIRNGYLTLAFSGVSKQRKKIRSGGLNPAFSGGHKRAEVLRSPAFSRVPKQGDKIKRGCLTPILFTAHKWAEERCNTYILKGPTTTGQNQKWLPHPCLLGGPREDEMLHNRSTR